MALSVVLVQWWRLDLSEPLVERPSDGVYQVERVIDGDTLLLTNRQRVRLQGIDTPETVRPDHPVERWGPEAGAFTRRFVADAGDEVRLSFGAERIDRYGRWLAFVWHGERLLNEQLVREGLAEARLGYRYAGRMKRRLREAQEWARVNGRGLWAKATDNSAAGSQTHNPAPNTAPDATTTPRP